ncbi:MAG: 1-deoxy-D-xylulose-5-phosphate synthase [Candidatus Omnitrophica bacterium]|nr:1-deoxy-D-xylulose-5-phosphate synthase [Candidatus Omnitrophota bacterium]
MKTLLDTIESPQDLKKLPHEQLPHLAQEIRERILEVVSMQGGHLASPLGAVELAIALHYVFDAPKDLLLWDVGHQTYAHKLLTGRRERFSTLRQYGGISGLNNKNEGPYDPFTSGHGGTAISTALGLAVARDARGAEEKILAIIGDASLGEGMALEALNHAGHMKTDMIVVLNDNEMSISKTVGALSKYLNRMITDPRYNRIRREIGSLIEKMPRFGERMVKSARHLEELAKSLLVPGVLFEELGFRYFGPIDGHNIEQLIETFTALKKIRGPVLMHAVTKKGKGYELAENNPEKFHGVGAFDVKTGGAKKDRAVPDKIKVPADKGITYTRAFSDALITLASCYERVVGVTAAMPEGTGLDVFREHFPDRYFDVGMAEQHAVGFSAGLARGGFIPVCAVYSSFLQRSYDQIFHDVCLQDLHVIFAIDRAGVVGSDGPTHHGVMDIAYLRSMPGLYVLAPKDTDELKDMLEWAARHHFPSAIRYPRGGVQYPQHAPCDVEALREPVTSGVAQVVRQGRDAAIWAIGNMVYPALDAAQLLAADGIEATVVNARFIAPLDEALLTELGGDISLFCTVEDGILDGGFGSAVGEALSRLNLDTVKKISLGLPRKFIVHGPQEQLLAEYGLSSEGIYTAVKNVLHKSEEKSIAGNAQ